jgi:hypothetical protein
MISILKKFSIAALMILVVFMISSKEEISGAQAHEKNLAGPSGSNYLLDLDFHPSTSFFLQAGSSTIYFPFVLNQGPSIQTQVIVFHPTGSSEPSRYGYCWSSSLDVLRPDAWRCVDTNSYLYDPCISPLNGTGYVVCDVYPLRGGDGFRLYLTQPLPAPAPIDPELEKSFAWAMQLYGGTTCSLIQASTWPTCLPRYSCSDGLDVKDYPNPGVLWTA